MLATSAARPLALIPLVFGFLIASVGCVRGAPQAAPSACVLPVTVALNPSERINPDEHGTPLPTVVRLLQLRRASRLEEADFAELWEQLEPTLGDDLVQKRELTVFPGRAQRVPLELDPASRFLVGMAVFRQPTGTQWRAVVALPASERMCAAYAEAPPETAVDFALDGHRIEARSHLLPPTNHADLPDDVTAGAASADDAASSGPRAPAPGGP